MYKIRIKYEINTISEDTVSDTSILATRESAKNHKIGKRQESSVYAYQYCRSKEKGRMSIRMLPNFS